MGLTKVTMGLLSGLAAKVLDIMKDHSNINLGEAKAATGTFVDFDIPEGVKRITVMFDGVSTNGTSYFDVRVGAGAIESSGYVGSATWVDASNGNILLSSGFTIITSAAAYLVSGTLVLSKVTGNSWTAEGMLAASTAARTFQTAGKKVLSNTLDRIRITTVNGTDQFDAGTVNVSWEF